MALGRNMVSAVLAGASVIMALACLPMAAFAQGDPNAPSQDGKAELMARMTAFKAAAENADDRARVAAAREVFAFLAGDNPSITNFLFVSMSQQIFVELSDIPVTSAVMQPLVDDFERLERQYRASGQGGLELRVAHAKGYFLPADARLGQARAAHRRAAELGLLKHEIVHRVRVTIEEIARRLRDEGRVEESLRAQDDTWSELAAAGLDDTVPSWTQQLLYAETLTLARRDAEADARFDRLFETAPEGSRQLQLSLNQAAYFRNIVGRFEAAEAPGLFAALAAEKLMGREAIATQKARYNYALALLGQGKAATALPYLEEALPLQLAEEAKGIFADRSKADTIILLTTLARARAQVPGQELAGQQAAEDASERLRLRQKSRLEGQERADPAATAIAKVIARSNRRDPLASAYDMALFAGWAARDADDAPLDSAFRAAQDLTASEAGNAISEAAARTIAGDGPLGELVRQRQDAAAAIVSKTQEFRSVSLGTDTAAATALRAEIQQLGALLAGLDQRLETEFSGYSDLVAPRSVPVTELQSLLAPDEALVMTLPSEGAQYVFAISATGSAWHRIDGGAELVGQAVDRLKCRIDEATCSVADLEAAYAAEDRSVATPVDTYYPRYDRATAYALYQALIEPVASVLPEGGRIYTVSRGPVAGLPLAVLVASPPAGDPESGDAADLQATDWLGRHFAFINLPSVSALRLAQAGPSASADRAGRMPLVGYGAPVLLGAADSKARSGSSGRRFRGGIGVRAAGLLQLSGDRVMASVDKLRRLDPLPGTLAELRTLAQRVGGGQGARVGADATERAVKADADLPRADTVVFATHGLLPSELGPGSEPGLVLTPPQVASALDDGLLTASEAAELTLTARWVVLSACNTATPASQESGGESLSSLARSFLYAGARNLLASHWRVADDATATLTTEVLGNREASPARALAQAMDTIRTGQRPDGSAVEGWKPHWAHPASWAPFALITNRDRE